MPTSPELLAVIKPTLVLASEPPKFTTYEVSVPLGLRCWR